MLPLLKGKENRRVVAPDNGAKTERGNGRTNSVRPNKGSEKKGNRIVVDLMARKREGRKRFPGYFLSKKK